MVSTCSDVGELPVFSVVLYGYANYHKICIKLLRDAINQSPKTGFDRLISTSLSKMAESYSATSIQNISECFC